MSSAPALDGPGVSSVIVSTFLLTQGRAAQTTGIVETVWHPVYKYQIKIREKKNRFNLRGRPRVKAPVCSASDIICSHGYGLQHLSKRWTGDLWVALQVTRFHS